MHTPQLFIPLLPLVLGTVQLGQAFVVRDTASGGPGCGKALPSGVKPGALGTNISTTSFGVPRSYLLHVPANYNSTKPTPLYLSFHGADRNATEQEGLSQFSNPFFNPDGIAVYPQGLNEKWLSNPRVSAAFPNDLDFVSTLLAELNSTLCVDSSRVYAAGKSNGGGFTNVIACNSTVGPRFAAFAAVSGAFYNDSLVDGIGPCDNPGTKQTPFIEFHGINDTTVPYFGKPGTKGTPVNETQPGIPSWLNMWTRLNGCPAGTKPHNTSEFMNNVTVESFTCNGHDGIVTHYAEDNLGHIWPSTVLNDDCVQIKSQCPMGHYFFNATSVIFDFFSQYQLPSSRG